MIYRMLILLCLGAMLLPRIADAQSPDLPQTFDNGVVSFAYPAGWTVIEQYGAIYITNNPSMIQNDFVATPDQALIILHGGIFSLQSLGLDEETFTFEAVAQTLASRVSNQDALEIGNSTEINGQSALQFTIGVEMQQVSNVHGYVVETATTYFTAVLSTSADNEATFIPTLEAIIETVKYAPMERTQQGEVVWQYQTEATNETWNSNLRGIVASGQDNTLYIGNGQRLHVLSSEGEYLYPIPLEGIANLDDIALEDHGVIWVADSRLGEVRSYLLTLPEAIPQQTISLERVNFGAQLALTHDLPQQLVVMEIEGELIEAQTYRFRVIDTESGELQHQFELSSPTPTSSDVTLSVVGQEIYLLNLLGQMTVMDIQGNVLRQYSLTPLPSLNLEAGGIGSNGWAYYGTEQGIFVYDEQGIYQYEFGQAQVIPSDSATPAPMFASGEFYFPRGLLALDNDIVVVDSNFQYAQVVRIAFPE